MKIAERFEVIIGTFFLTALLFSIGQGCTNEQQNVDSTPEVSPAIEVPQTTSTQIPTYMQEPEPLIQEPDQQTNINPTPATAPSTPTEPVPTIDQKPITTPSSTKTCCKYCKTSKACGTPAFQKT